MSQFFILKLNYMLNITRIILLIIIIILLFLIIKSNKIEHFFDDDEYKYVRHNLLNSNSSSIIENTQKCNNYCNSIKNTNCNSLCKQYGENMSDNYKYQTHIFGSAFDEFEKE